VPFPSAMWPFGPFARRVIDAMKTQGLDEGAIAEMEWQLGYLLGRFGELELLEIDVAGVDDFQDDLADRAELNREHTVRRSPPPGTIKPNDGQKDEHSERALSNGSINAILMLLSEIMQRAFDAGYVPQNPLKVGERRDRFLPTPKRGPTLPKLD
jgi:hypothetical protein